MGDLYKLGSDKLKAEMEEGIKKAVEQGMPKEMAEMQYKMLFEELIKKSDEDTEFNDQILLEHKSWERCFKYMSAKAKGMAKNASGVAIISTVLFQWIYEYYALDDKEEMLKKNDEAKKEIKEEVKEVENIPEEDIPEEDIPKEDIETEEAVKEEGVIQEEEPVMPKPTKEKEDNSQLSGQTSIFDFL